MPPPTARPINTKKSGKFVWKPMLPTSNPEFKALTEIVVLSALVRAYIDVGKMQEATTYLQLMEAIEHRTDERKNLHLLALKHYYFAQGAYKKRSKRV